MAEPSEVVELSEVVEVLSESQKRESPAHHQLEAEEVELVEPSVDLSPVPHQ